MNQPEAQANETVAENGASVPVERSGDSLKKVLESLIFVSDGPVTAKRLARAARATLAEVQPLLDELVADYAPRGVHLYYVAGGYQFRSARETSDFVKTLVAPKPVRLTRAQLETLAIIAYRQPITRPEVDDVRGVDSGSSLKVLTERNLVKILGRKDEPGRPLVYGTTPRFLEFFGLGSLKDLPTLQEFSDLTDEHKALFEERTGESIDIAAAELAAAEAMEDAEEELRAQEDAALAEFEALNADTGADTGADTDAGSDTVTGSDSTTDPEPDPDWDEEDDEDDDWDEDEEDDE